jgi:HrpA-like RNA helicase
MKFEWVTGPPAETVLRALENLVAAGMVGEDGRLTVVGEKVAECPVEVNIARMVSQVGRRFDTFLLVYFSCSLQRSTAAVKKCSL